MLPLPGWAGQTNTRALIHIPTKSLTSMPLFFGKDKGFLLVKASTSIWS